jgi:hypothetical protein
LRAQAYVTQLALAAARAAWHDAAMPHQPAVPSDRELEPRHGQWAQLAFEWHARIYLLVNLFLVAIWAVTSGFGYFWPIWPILGWGLGLAVHAIATYSFPGRD